MNLANSWEQREFGYYFDERNERSGEGEMISVTINSGIKKFNELNRFDTKPEDLSKYKRVLVGDIAYNSMRMWQGASGYSPYNGILSPAYTVITPKNGVSSRFFAYVLKRPRMIHLFEINSQGLTKDTWNLKFPAFSPIPVCAPKSELEQKTIAKILQSVDDLITLHQCKQIKSYSNVTSELTRTPDRNTCITWEQRKVSDMFKITRGYVLASTLTKVDKTEKNPYPVYSSQTKDRGLMGYYKHFLYENAITWTTDGANAGTVNYRAGKFYCTNVCGVLLTNNTTPNQMIAEALNKVAKGYVSYVGNPKLMNNVMAEIEISLPLYEEEQQQISELLFQLDDLITLHQCKVTLRFGKIDYVLKEEKSQKNYITWEQRKLGEMGSTFTGLSGKTKEDFGHGAGKFVTYMNVFLNPVSDLLRTESVEIDNSQCTVKYGDVFFTTSSETPEEVGMSSVWLEKTENTYLNSFCFGYRPTELLDPYYMAYMLRSEAVRKKIVYLAQGISRYNISKNGVMQIAVPIPSLFEQQKIGEQFKNLDNLITLHQRVDKFT